MDSPGKGYNIKKKLNHWTFTITEGDNEGNNQQTCRNINKNYPIKKRKIMKQNLHTVRDLWISIKYSNICVIVAFE